MDKAMKHYELLFILTSDTETKAQETLVETLTKLTETAKGKVEKHDIWGKKTFSYPVKKHRDGIYHLLSLSMNSSAVPAFEKKVKLEEKIVRYLLIVKD